jgi:hypothetical protein
LLPGAAASVSLPLDIGTATDTIPVHLMGTWQATAGPPPGLKPCL